MIQSKRVRTALIGAGPRGMYLAGLYSRQSHPGFDLKAVCDLDPQRLDGARQAFGNQVAYHADMGEMLARDDIDAVIVATHDPHHVAPTLAGLRTGRHVLCEKPLCQTVEDARFIVQEARKAAGIFMIGFELRQCSLFLAMKRLLDEGRIGEVKIGHAMDNVSVGGRYYFNNPSRNRKSVVKTLLLQKASHSLDLLNWFMGSNPVKVYGIGGLDFYGGIEEPGFKCRDCTRADCPYRMLPCGFQPGDGEEKPDECVWSKAMDLNDNSELCISYANGGKATFHECHFTPDYSREFWLVGTKGKMYGYYDGPGRFRIRIEYSYSPERRTEEFRPTRREGGHGGSDDALREEFHRRIVEDDRPTEAQSSAYYSTALAVCAERSIESGLPVSIPPLD